MPKFEVHVMQGDTLHTYFTDTVHYVAEPTDNPDKVVLMLEARPMNGPQRKGIKTRFPVAHVISVTERES